MASNSKIVPDVSYLRECFSYSDGCLTWKTRPASHFASMRTARMWNAKNAGKIAGRPMADGSGYIQVGLNKERHLLHRLIAALHGIDTSDVVDHIDGNVKNNCVENLRGCTKQQNTQNNAGWRKKRSPVGVSQIKTGKWVAYIRDNGVHKHLGTFKEQQHAIAARRAAEILHYGEFSRASHSARGVELDYLEHA